MNLPVSGDYIISLFKQFGLRPHVVHHTESYEMIRSSVAAGLGVAVQNMRPLIDETYGGLKVQCRPIAEKTSAPQLVLVTRRGASSSRQSKIFSKYCRELMHSDLAKRLIVS